MDRSVDGTDATPALTGQFGELYREQFAFVYATLLRLGVPAAAVDDATQDVFVTVHRKLSSFEGRAPLRSWLFGIVRRVAFRYRRSAQRVDVKLRALASAVPPADDLAEAIERHERSALLLRALDRLDDDKRTALTLHVFEDLRGPEVAALLGIAVDTAYSRIKAARRELGQHLAELGVGAEADALVEATRRTTTPDRAATRRVAALLAVRVGIATRTLVGISMVWPSIAGAIAIAATATAIAVPPRPPPATARDVASTPADDPRTPAPAQYVAHYDPQAAAIEPSAPPTVEPIVPAGVRRPPAPGLVPGSQAELAAEVELVTAAKRALDRGAAEAALVELDAHARRFPDGQLARERAGYRAIALCALDRTAAGRGEAQVFLADHGGSVLATRVATACGLP